MKTPSFNFDIESEWELVNTEQISNLTFVNELYQLPSNCVIKITRNDDYELEVTMTGVLSDVKLLSGKEKLLEGEFLKDEVVRGFSLHNSYEYEITGFYIGPHTTNPISLEESSFSAKVGVDSILRKRVNRENSEKHIDWFLSPGFNYTFSGVTEWTEYKRKTKERKGVDVIDGKSGSFKIVSPLDNSSMSRNFVLIESNSLKFIIAKVPDGIGPYWSKSICIEYRREWGIPNESIRDCIAYLVSFVFGAQLMQVGYSVFDSADNILESFHFNSWVTNCKKICRTSIMPPVQTKWTTNTIKIKELIEQTLPIYIKLNASIPLNTILSTYFVSKVTYLGMNLPLLANSIEQLAHIMLKEHPEIKYYYMQYDVFISLIADELRTIQEKIKDLDGKDKILNKIRSASLRGPNDKLTMLFELIDLKIGGIELQAMKARNKMVHSSISNDDDSQIQTMIRLTRAYESLFNRIILKLLNYDGEYIDYYSIGHKLRHIDIPVGE